MSRTFFTADLHLQHRLVAGHRHFWHIDDEGFTVPDIAAHDAKLALTWDKRVRHEDRVFVLGDVAMNFTPEVADWLRARPGRKHLIAGNHDQAHPMHSKYLQRLPAFLEVFETVQPFLRLKMLGETVLLSHFPYFGEGSRPGPDRYTQYRLRDEGALLLHGHTHGEETSHGHQFHVGLDAWDLELVSDDIIHAWVQEHIDAKKDEALSA